MNEKRVTLKLTLDHSIAIRLNQTDVDTPFKETRCGSQSQELLIIKFEGKEIGFCVIALDLNPEVAKFFICPEFRGNAGPAVAAAREVFSYIERRPCVSYSLQSLENNERAWRFWEKAVKGRVARTSGWNYLIGVWD